MLSHRRQIWTRGGRGTYDPRLLNFLRGYKGLLPRSYPNRQVRGPASTKNLRSICLAINYIWTRYRVSTQWRVNTKSALLFLEGYSAVRNIPIKLLIGASRGLHLRRDTAAT